MKRTYAKPEILFEDFAVSTNIAGDCEVKTYAPSNTQCGMFFEGVGMVFMSSMNGCSYKIIGTDDGEYNGICYHVSSNGQNIFNS